MLLKNTVSCIYLTQFKDPAEVSLIEFTRRPGASGSFTRMKTG